MTDEDLRGGRLRHGMLLGFLAAMAVLVLASCGSDDDGGGDSGSATPEEDVQRGGAVIVGISQDINGWDPYLDQISTTALNMVKAVYDPMTVLNGEGRAEPYLVEALESSDDFTQWTITLRDGVRFHNGDELTPEIVANHIKGMQLSPLTQYSFGPVAAVGVVDELASQQFADGEITEEEYDLLRRQVVVTMEEPWSTFPAFLASYQTGFIAHPSMLDGETEDPIGTGPFVLDEWVPGDRVVANRNDDYWREGLPYLDQVEFRILTDPETRYQSVGSGDIDLMISNATGQVAELSEAELPEDQVLYPEQGAGDELLVLLNTQSGPTADVEVRRALQLASDPGALNDQLFDGFYETADTPYVESSFWYSDPGWPEPDVEAATALVDAWEAENGPLTIQLYAANTVDDLDTAQALQQQWAEAGIDTAIESADESTALTVVPFGNYQAFLQKFLNGSDPDEHYPFWSPDNIGPPGELAINFTRYTSPVMEENLRAARETDDQDERAALYGEMWADWAENVPYLFLLHTPYIMVANANLNGLETITTPEGEPAAAFTFASIFLTETWRTQ